MGLLALALLASISLQLVVPLILKRFIDSALVGTAIGSLTAAGFAYLIASVFNQVLSATATYLGAQVGMGGDE